MDSRGGYVSKILCVKTKESGPLGGVGGGVHAQEGVLLFLELIGLSYERPYLVLDLNLISNLYVTRRFTLVKYLISGLQVLLS